MVEEVLPNQMSYICERYGHVRLPFVMERVEN